MEIIPLLAIVGPTASGKTALAVALAKRCGGEVVSADSMQIYRGMEIATAKPTVSERDGVPHHLIDFLPPDAVYSVAQYAKDARRCIREIHVRGRLPILCGGTGLYVDAVLDHLQFPDVETDYALRAELERRADTEGMQRLLEELRTVDPETAAALHPHNRGRVIRALEVYRLTGKTMGEQRRLSRREAAPYRQCCLGLDYRDRQKLYDRIDRRVDAMLQAGLLDECRRALDGGLSDTAAQAIGYKELAPYFAGLLPLEDCVDRLKRATRRYAKRQLTWFRRRDGIVWLYPDTACEQEILTKAQKCMEDSGIV